MRKLFYLIIFHVAFFGFSQENKNNFSFDFNQTNLNEVIQIIESKSEYKFYFDPEWIDSEKELINETYNNKNIETILSSVFSKTLLNYFIDDTNIIITKNIVIHDKLPEGYFDKKEENSVITQKIVEPIFTRQYDTIDDSSPKKEKILILGKEIKKSNKKSWTLSGHIKEKKTGQPLTNVVVKIRNKKIETLTDNLGYYEIEVPVGVNYIETDFFNYVKVVKKVILYSNGTLNINLDERVNILDEVVINSKKNDNIKSSITGATTIDIEGIKNIPLVLGERDIFKVATILPGVKQTGEGSSGYNVRGGKEDQNLILLDHGLIYNPSHFFGFFSSVNPYTTKKADIYKGSIPAEYGGRLSSVFDISTKNGNLTKFSGEGGIGPVTSNLAISTPIVKDKSSIMIGGRATYSGWILKSLKEESIKNSSASFYDGTIKYYNKLNNNNNIESTIYYSNDAFSISSDSLFKYSNRLVSLKWDHIFNEKNKGSIIFTNSEYKFNINYMGDYLKAFDFGYKINESQVMLKLNHSFNEKHKFNYGFSSKLYNINPGYLSPKNNESTLIPITIEKEKGIESAIYISDNYKFNKKLLIDYGFRYSTFSALGPSTQKIYQEGLPLNEATIIESKEYKNHEAYKTYGGIEPRVSARYFLGNNLSIKGSYDKTFQYIHLLSSNTTQSPTDTWKLSDLNVKPQNAQQFSLGMYKNIPKNDIEMSIEGYYKILKNFLDYKVAANILLNENIERELLQGVGKAYGLEFLIKKNSGKLNGWVGYTYSRTFIKLDSPFNDEKVNNGKYFPANFDKPHDISIVLNYRLTKRYSFSSNFIYQTGRPITYPVGKYNYGNAQYTMYSDRNSFRIPDYYRLDIGINMEGNHKIKKLAHSFWNFSVYNVLGRNNPYSIYFITENGQIKAYKTSIFAIPVPTITYNFKF